LKESKGHVRAAVDFLLSQIKRCYYVDCLQDVSMSVVENFAEIPALPVFLKVIRNQGAKFHSDLLVDFEKKVKS
jgi:hypothetical protein